MDYEFIFLSNISNKDLLDVLYHQISKFTCNSQKYDDTIGSPYLQARLDFDDSDIAFFNEEYNLIINKGISFLLPSKSCEEKGDDILISILKYLIKNYITGDYMLLLNSTMVFQRQDNVFSTREEFDNFKYPKEIIKKFLK